MGLTCSLELPTQPETRGIVAGTDTVDPEISLPHPQTLIYLPNSAMKNHGVALVLVFPKLSLF